MEIVVLEEIKAKGKLYLLKDRVLQQAIEKNLHFKVSINPKLLWKDNKNLKF